jgi:glutathione S-transferase
MVLKLHTGGISSCGRRVAVILFEKQVPFQLIEPDFAAAEHKSPEWKANQPFGQMPYIDDDGFILFESRAIARYIATKYASSGTDLLPDPNDLKAMALVDQGISIETSNFNPAAEGLFVEITMKKCV